MKAEPELWAERLSGRVLPTGSVRLLPKGRIEELPGFAEGAWWVQDVAASLPAQLLGDVAGKRVADLCAAPGGKTAQLLLAGASVVAVDSSKTRLGLLAENLKRLGLEAETVQADAALWQPEERFDAILLDAPCSSTGTIRRHPDIPYLKSDKDIAALAALQAPAARQRRHPAQARRQAGLLDLLARAGGRRERRSRRCWRANARLRLDPIEPGRAFRRHAWTKPRAASGRFPTNLSSKRPNGAAWTGFLPPG